MRAADAWRYVSASRWIKETSRRASIEYCASCVDNARSWLNIDES